jgi:hypothetical protein
MMTKADEYIAKARECEERAEHVRDPFLKQQMLEIAQKWRAMAAYGKKFAR